MGFIILLILAICSVILYIRNSKVAHENKIIATKKDKERRREYAQKMAEQVDEIRKKEWAQKMAEIRRQKKIDEEQKEAKRIEQERRRKENLVRLFEKVGATINFTDSFAEITTDEQVILSDLFFSLGKVKYAWTCNIKDIDGKDLVFFEDNYINFCHDDITKRIDTEKDLEKILFCYLENRKLYRTTVKISNIIKDGLMNVNSIVSDTDNTKERIEHALTISNYGDIFKKSIECVENNDMLVVNYDLPCISELPTIKEYKYIASRKEISIKKQPESYITKLYDQVLYSITLRSIFEAFYIDNTHQYNCITFNGFVSTINTSTGILERKCILSIQTNRDKFSAINLELVDPKACFKSLKGVSAAKLIDESPIIPILAFNRHDKRFIEGRNIDIDKGTNLAAMHWEDFEQLVRELFELEFANNGGEVHVTQASRDGGVDAVIFDPDPLRGGKIVIQAKRYTNTVGVSAVRDLYGTVINEGANTGILITTSDYGHDSYEFAKDKPLKLLNGGHLLSLLHKHGRSAHINIEDAREQFKNAKN